MPTLDGIEIREVHEVTCPKHGVIGTTGSNESARVRQRQHYEWRHQPDPTDRLCLWRWPIGGVRPGYRLCQEPAAHEGMHRDEDGRFSEIGSLPRLGLEAPA